MDFVQRTIDLARRNVDEGGLPFATVIVREGNILAESPNRVVQTHDPTAHAEILAIRQACTERETDDLIGSTVYVMAHPCPMCLGALYQCSPDEVVFLTTREAYAPFFEQHSKYFDSNTFYDEFAKDWEQRRLPMRHEPRDAALDVYRLWDRAGRNRAQNGTATSANE
ncbi:nucleoside deaminase [Streptomyces tirandamycinicus]|uniref:nucleoside deaminase n=1 Tax=Streptomyces tirandamycinicus TaxID=2174846 RepID=UPI00226F20EB|nr:nucleoside deaminase [Streptomyces tirandamycinicus]MCY0982104.1 nucleoside deaminase [Streptomyces tirandamycinicus]